MFYDSIEPLDVKESCEHSLLNNDYFLSAMAILAQRPPLIERLFITKEWNDKGVYRLRLCKDGCWREVTIDDLFPCEPRGQPLFSGCQNNELWMMLLEKAYAKVHGSYYLLKGGFVSEALLDLTGCPTSCYNLSDDCVQHFVANGQFWELLKHFWNEGYLLAFSTPGEERWTTMQPKRVHDDSVDQYMFRGEPKVTTVVDAEGRETAQRETRMPLGQGFAILQIRELDGGNVQLLQLRAPLGKYEWTGDWSERSAKWTPELLKEIKQGEREDIGGGAMYHQTEDDETDENVFWMSY